MQWDELHFCGIRTVNEITYITISYFFSGVILSNRCFVFGTITSTSCPRDKRCFLTWVPKLSDAEEFASNTLCCVLVFGKDGNVGFTLLIFAKRNLAPSTAKLHRINQEIGTKTFEDQLVEVSFETFFFGLIRLVFSLKRQ